jgi:hypothetical protein
VPIVTADRFVLNAGEFDVGRVVERRPAKPQETGR